MTRRDAILALLGDALHRAELAEAKGAAPLSEYREAVVVAEVARQELVKAIDELIVDAERWQFFRDTGFVTVSEDGEVCCGVSFDEYDGYREAHPELVHALDTAGVVYLYDEQLAAKAERFLDDRRAEFIAAQAAPDADATGSPA